MTEDEFAARSPLPRMPPALDFSEQLKVLHMIRYIRELRAELDPIAKPPTVARVTRITPRQQSQLFDLFRTIDDLFPGGATLWPEPTPEQCA